MMMLGDHSLQHSVISVVYSIHNMRVIFLSGLVLLSYVCVFSTYLRSPKDILFFSISMQTNPIYVQVATSYGDLYHHLLCIYRFINMEVHPTIDIEVHVAE
jgi:hypothetical protein